MKKTNIKERSGCSRGVCERQEQSSDSRDREGGSGGRNVSSVPGKKTIKAADSCHAGQAQHYLLFAHLTWLIFNNVEIFILII